MGNAALTPKEQYKYDVIIQVINHEIRPGAAAKLLGVSTRQVRRLKTAIQNGGAQAVIHGLKGGLGNHRIDPSVKKKAIAAIYEIYPDFKPTLATEKLQERHAIQVSVETTRLWMTQKGLWKIRPHKQPVYRSWRPRKDYYGELIQFDGSYHHWFENRYANENGNSEVCMLAGIDDATGRITRATFSANEGVIAVFEFWKQYVLIHGKPLAIYLDKFSTYKINHQAAVDNHELMTQFERAMKALGIELITAHSPEAKGRVERLFGTLQDRLVKEMRLEGINTPEDGNSFLQEIYIPIFNRRFSVAPAQEEDLHRPLSALDCKNLNRIFSIQSTRRVNNDFTIQFKNTWYQLLEIQPTTVRPREAVIIEEWLDGTTHVNFKNHDLSYMVLPGKPQKSKKQPTILTNHRLNWKPPLNHPWRKWRP